MLLFWIGFGIIFLIIEILTTTFYGFALAIASFVVAGYVGLNNIQEIDIIQGVIFVVVGLIASFWFSKISKNALHTKDEKPQWLDMYIGESRRVHLIGEDFKIKLDGVDYILVSDDALEDNDLVEIVDRRGSVFIGEKI